MEFNDHFSVKRDLDVLARVYESGLEYKGFLNLLIKNCLRERKKYDKSFIERVKKIKSKGDCTLGELAFIAKKIIDRDIELTVEYDSRDVIRELINKELIYINDYNKILFSLLNVIVKNGGINDKKHDYLYERCGGLLCKLSRLTEKLDMISKRGCVVNYKKMDNVKNACFDYLDKLDKAYIKKFNTSPPNEKEFEKNGFDFNVFRS